MIKPRQHIQKARRTLASGHYLLTGDFTEQAGRDAYLAAFHAAQAFIVAQTGKEPKSHSGARSEFARLAQHDDRISHSFIAFLGRAYDLKTYADYDGDQPISKQDATEALEIAAKLVEIVTATLGDD